MQTPQTNWSILKQALFAILIGAAINALTIVLQFGIEWLRAIPVEAPGVVVGMTKYLMSWKSSLHA